MGLSELFGGEVGDAEDEERTVRTAANLFMWTGFVALLWAGIVGVADGSAGTIVASVTTVIAFLVVGWVVTRRSASATHMVTALLLLGVAFTAWILGDSVAGYLDNPVLTLTLLPVAVVVLVQTGGVVLAHVLSEKHPSLTMELEGGRPMHLLLQAATVPLIWAAFLVIVVGDPQATAGLVAGAGLVAVYASAAGHLARRGRVPHHVVAGSLLALLGNAWYVFQFVNVTGTSAELAAGQGLALAGMLLAAFPVALSLVALHDLRQEADRPLRLFDGRSDEPPADAAEAEGD